jgi:hypothetical protein
VLAAPADLPGEDTLLPLLILQIETDAVLCMTRRMERLDLDVLAESEFILVLDDRVGPGRSGAGVRLDGGPLGVVRQLWICAETRSKSRQKGTN